MSYWNYFTVIRTTSLNYTHAHGFTNTTGRYVPGAAVNDRWGRYYKFITQYRELEKVMASLSPAEQTENRIYTVTSSIYLGRLSQLEKLLQFFASENSKQSFCFSCISIKSKH